MILKKKKATPATVVIDATPPPTMPPEKKIMVSLDGMGSPSDCLSIDFDGGGYASKHAKVAVFKINERGYETKKRFRITLAKLSMLIQLHGDPE